MKAANSPEHPSRLSYVANKRTIRMLYAIGFMVIQSHYTTSCA